MRSILMLSMMLFTFNALALDQPPVTAPKTLQCREILNVVGSALLEKRTINLTRATIIQSADDDLFKVDLNDGDDITEYVFQREEIKALMDGRVTLIRGLSNDGYVWADGAHVTDLMVLECSL